VAGRLYWEAHVFGQQLLSFSTNGFLDKKGYVEPTLNTGESYVTQISIVIVGLLIVTFVVYVCLKK